MSDAGTAAASLEEALAARARLAEKLRCPPYLHALFGALYGALVASWAGSDAVVFEVEAVVILIAAGMFLWMRKKMGFFVNGYRKGATRPVVAALLMLYFVCFGLAAWCKAELHLAWPALVLGALMFCVGTYSSVLWQRTYRRELDPTLGGLALGRKA